MMTLLDSTLADTHAGHDDTSPFSPPEGWEGDSAAYMALMRERYNDRLHGQRMFVMVRGSAMSYDIRCTGPFAREAAAIITRLGGKVASC